MRSWANWFEERVDRKRAPFGLMDVLDLVDAYRETFRLHGGPIDDADIARRVFN